MIFDNWEGLRKAGQRLCIAATINPQVWNEAQTYLGQDLAIATLAVTIQRTEDGNVLNPGAYLRTLVQRGRAGELRISRSLFSLASTRDQKLTIEEPSGFPLQPITWTPWADLVRKYAPKPTPDIELVANAFRAWCRKGNIDLDQPIIEKAFIGFCRKWSPNRAREWGIPADTEETAFW